MTAKRFIRTIAGEIYDSENDSFIHQDYVGKPIEYEDECIKLLNELHEENKYLKSLKWNQDCINEISIGISQRQLLEEENEQLRQQLIEKERMLDVRDKIIGDVSKALNGELE